MFLGTIDDNVRRYIAGNRASFNGQEIVVGCSGNFTSEKVLLQEATPLAVHSNDVALLVRRWRAEQVSDVTQWQALNVKRIDRAINAIWGDVADGKLPAIDRMQKLIEQQGRLLGFDVSTHIEAERIAVVIDR